MVYARVGDDWNPYQLFLPQLHLQAAAGGSRGPKGCVAGRTGGQPHTLSGNNGFQAMIPRPALVFHKNNLDVTNRVHDNS